MKDIIIKKLKDLISTLTDKAADSFISENVPEEPTIDDYTSLLDKVRSGKIEP